MDKNSFSEMIKAVQQFHDKHQFNQVGGEDMVYRVALMAEELGEISSCVSKGKSRQVLAEECADLLILLLGNEIAADFDLNQAFWQKIEKLKKRKSKIINGRVRVSEFPEDHENKFSK